MKRTKVSKIYELDMDKEGGAIWVNAYKEIVICEDDKDIWTVENEKLCRN